jgi:hypothetical protein
VIFDLDSLAEVTKNFNSLTKFSSRNILQSARREMQLDDVEGWRGRERERESGRERREGLRGKTLIL